MRLFILLVAILSSSLYAAESKSLDDQRIWKLPNDKRSIFLDQGVFHSKNGKKNSGQYKIVDMRNSYKKSRGYERIVFDFASKTIPSLYGHISKESKVVKVDFFNTKTTSKNLDVINSKFIKGVDFFTFEKDTSLEIKLKENVVFDVFYLHNPGRLVIDIRK